MNVSKRSEYKYNLNVFQAKKTISNLVKLIFLIFVVGLIFFLVLYVSDFGFDPVMSIINQQIIWVLFITSIGLGCSSFIVQSISNNKMADTSILGIGSVNLLVITICVALLNNSSQESIDQFLIGLPFFCIVFSILASWVIYFLSKKETFKISKKFILGGILLNFLFTAFSTSISSLLKSAKQQIINPYINGKVEQVEQLYVYVGAAFLILCLIWMFFILKKFRIVTTNVYVASQLGINVKNIYFQALTISGIMTGIAFFLTGNVVFLGLIGGNIAYTMFKRNYQYTFLASGFIAFIIIAFTYFINKNIINKSSVNTAYLIPIFSIPYFLYLLLKKA